MTNRALELLLILGIGFLVVASSLYQPGVAPRRAQSAESGSPSNRGVISHSPSARSLFAVTSSPSNNAAAGSGNGSLYLVTFDEAGLANGTLWGVTALGNATNSSTSKIVIRSPPGNFSFSVKIPVGYLGPTRGVFEVTDKNTTVSLTYDPLIHLTFEEVGLIPGWNWSVTLNGSGTDFSAETRTSVDATIVFQEIPDVYNFTTVASTFTALPSVGDATVGNLPSTVTITYVPFPGLLHLSVSPTAAQVWIDGFVVSFENGHYSANMTPGLYSVEALAAGFAPYFNNVSLTRGNETTLTISLESLGGRVGSGFGTFISPLALAVFVGLLILVGLLLIGVAYYRARATRLSHTAGSNTAFSNSSSGAPPPQSP
ncbi:MAG: hypothetical protein WA549_09135 [Thermoplasmata archaeon]